MNIEIDPYAGFCFGVENAIGIAEDNLSTEKQLFSLGEIVHNENEIRRLKAEGLSTIDHAFFKNLKNRAVLIRTHGEPPETYEQAAKNNIRLVEATCPVVLKLQLRVKKTWKEMKNQGGQVVIAGKASHPETIGLNGQTGNQAIIIEKIEDIGKVDFSKPVTLFAQTTLGKEKYGELKTILSQKMKEAGNEHKFKAVNSICGQVSNRIPALRSFCKKHDIIVFVSGKNSSNGRALFSICRESNKRSYHISLLEELDPGWFSGNLSVGISGATSTPLWLMKATAEKISKIAHVSE